jgi:glycosyltransferase involved in cell wall biosynthesis/SAM-dependent methyltransferase
MDVCTIIAKNYLAQARVLARSFAEHHPGVRFHVLVIDETEGWIDAAAEPFELVTIEQLGIERFQDMAVMYDVLELSTAVKPWLLKWLLDRSSDSAVVYLDPDMRLYGPLDDMFAAVAEHGLVLSPHNLEPMPRDGKKPSEQDILIAGVYNLGFVGINSGAFADELLEWWAIRLERDCIVDPERGYFVDQRWMDFAPGMAESFHLLRDPGFNVAYWNLHSRPVSYDGAWRVRGDVPLRLFHFSGYDYRRPQTLSKHQDRIVLADLPELRRLCDEYAAALVEEGVEEVSRHPYTYATTASGIPLDGVLRRFYRDRTLQGFDASPFTPEGEAAFLAELNAPAPRGGRHGVTRYLQALYDRRPDLQRAYADLEEDGAGFMGWVHTWGRSQVPIHDALAPAAAAPEATVQPAPAPNGPLPVLGVNVAGYLTSEMGVGEVARQLTGALDAASIPSLPINLIPPRGRHDHTFASVPIARGGHPVNLVCVNADMLPQFAADAGEAFFEHRYTIGMWWWEVSSFPQRWQSSFDLVDEIWAGSRFVADALSKVSPVPVVHVPMPVTLPARPTVARAELGLPGDFVFLFVYDYNSILARKNPLGLLDAFVRAFPDAGEGASLVLKSINGDLHPEQHASVVDAASEHAHVHVLDRFLSPADKNRLIVSCDAYVSLHRSEGFGITMAEAMLLGKPVIATGYSGNTDFMTPENSWPVRYELRPIGEGADPYPADAEWAEPDLGHAAASMREVFDDRAEAARRAARGVADIEAGHSLSAAGEAVARRLTAIRLDPRSAFAPAADARRRADAAAGLVQRGSQPPGGRRMVPGRAMARRALLRTLKPHTAYQATVDRDLAAGVQDLADRLDDVAGRVLALDTDRLRELRALERRLAALETGVGGSDLGTRLTSLDSRIDDLATQADATRAEQVRQRYALQSRGPVVSGDGRLAADLPAAPEQPWSHEYTEAHRAFVSRELQDASLLATLRDGAPLPERFGVGFDERVVEFPWVAAQELGGRVLDAGSALNHLHVLGRLRPRMGELDIVTLAPEDESFPELGVSYLYADLRALPMPDASYDRVLSISTLEHVGMDNTYYGADVAKAPDPQRELLAAVRELARVLRPGGDCYITVPAGSGERFAWVRTLTPAELDELVEAFAPEHHTLAFYRHSATGWQLSDRDAVAGETYRDHFTSGPPGPDRAVAARAVACLKLVKPA